jgi:hypothetical protein
MNEDMNKGMRSVCLTVFAFAMLYGITKIVKTDLGLYTITDNLLLIILLTLVTWIFFSNVFDAIDGAVRFIRQHIIKKPSEDWRGGKLAPSYEE